MSECLKIQTFFNNRYKFVATCKACGHNPQAFWLYNRSILKTPAFEDIFDEFMDLYGQNHLDEALNLLKTQAQNYPKWGMPEVSLTARSGAAQIAIKTRSKVSRPSGYLQSLAPAGPGRRYPYRRSPPL